MWYFFAITTVFSASSGVHGYKWVESCHQNDDLIIDQLYSDKVLVSYCKMLQVHKNHTLGLPISRLCTIFKLVKHRKIECYFGDQVKNVLGNEKFELPIKTGGFFDRIYLLLSILSVLYLLWLFTPLSRHMVTSILNCLKKSDRNIESSVGVESTEQIV